MNHEQRILNIFKNCEDGYQIKVLENKTNFLAPENRRIPFTEARYIHYRDEKLAS